METHPIEARASASRLISGVFLLGCFFRVVVFRKVCHYSKASNYGNTPYRSGAVLLPPAKCGCFCWGVSLWGVVFRKVCIYF